MLCESRSPNCSCICSLFLDSMTWNMDWTFWTTIWGAGLEEKRELQLLPILFFFIRIFQILTRKNVRGVRGGCRPGVSWTVLTDDTVTRRWAGPCQNVSCLILFSKIVRAAVFEMMDTFSNNHAPCVPLPRYSRQAWARGWSSLKHRSVM